MVDYSDGMPTIVWRAVAEWVRNCLKDRANWPLDRAPKANTIGRYYRYSIYEYSFTLSLHTKLIDGEWNWVYTLHCVKKFPNENPDACLSGFIFSEGTLAEVGYWAESIIHQRRPAVKLTDENQDYGQW